MRASYKDLIVRQVMDEQDPALISFWREELTGYTRPDLFKKRDVFVRYSYDMGPDFLKKISMAAVEWNSSVKAISLSAWLYLLKILQYENDVVTGLVTNIRPDTEDGDKVLGCFLNSVPLRMT